ncbi:hypothetical protein, partial [Burkholderia sp. SIMBA_024]|uniref:hypothetical protein n=1 Tax=Burkholderia sp. SIMBA_024 TaxID=3085768 RepID=UPI00397B4294
VASWQPNPSAVSYDIYKDGQKIDTVTDPTYPLPGEGSYSVVARDQSGNVIGVSDINSRVVESTSGNQAEAICQCIEKLRPVLEEIRDNTSV